MALCWLGSACFGQTRPRKFLRIDVQSDENVATIVQLDSRNVLRNPSPEYFLDQREAPELHVVNRKFLTDYSVEITGVTTPQRASIRGIEEASSLTLGAPSLIAPPSKGGGAGISARNTGDVFNQLLDETQANKPRTALESEYYYLQREVERVNADVLGLQARYDLVMGPHTPILGCEAPLGNQTLTDVAECLRDEIDFNRTDPWLTEPFRDEDEFRVINIRAQQWVQSVGALQKQIKRADLVSGVASVESEVAQLEDDVSAFSSNVGATLAAIELYSSLTGLAWNNDGTPTLPAGALRRDTQVEIRRDQLRAQIQNQLKTSATGAIAVVDDAELNKLVNKYLDVMRGAAGGFHVADDAVTALHRILVPIVPPIIPAPGIPRTLTAAATDFEDRADVLREDSAALLENIQTDVLTQIAAVNSLQSELLDRINYIYDHSAIAEPLVKHIDLTGHSGNLVVYYKIHWVENFARYQVVTPIVGGGDVGGNPQVAALPASPAATAASPAPGAVTPPASPATSTPGTPPAGDVVAQGSFEVHAFDRATVVAGFVFSFLHNNSFSAQRTTNGGNTTYTAVLSSQPFQPHVLIGVDYYFSPKDTFPTIAKGYRPQRSDFGLLGGVSANSLNNYFFGLAWEPSLGFNFSVGAHSGTETRLQGQSQIATSSVPTYDKRITKLFLMAGFDLQIFRKIFGKVTGVGISATATGSSQ